MRNLRRSFALVVAATILGAVPFTLRAFDLPQHRLVTHFALSQLQVTIAGQPRKFSKGAIDEIIKYNEKTDDNHNGSMAWVSPERHFTDEAFEASTKNLTKLKREILADLRRPVPRGSEARQKLGRALHGIQDFYSHSNWVELGNGGIANWLGISEMADPARNFQPCPVDPNVLGPGGGGGLTSGYYEGPLGCADALWWLPPGKCFHGNYNFLVQPCTGINKDKPGVGVPGGHTAAMNLAAEATTAFVQQITDELEGEDTALGALLGLKSIAFVVDTTESMNTELTELKAEITRLVERINDPISGDHPPTEWILVTLNDPQIGPPFVTESVGAFLGAVNGLTANEGGTCPEPSMAAALLATRTALPNSVVYIVTDATASDAIIQMQVTSEAKSRNTRISPFLSGSCSPIDPAYFALAQETGGQVTLLTEDNFAGLVEIVDAEARPDMQTILSARGATGGAIRTFDLPVDGSLARLVVSTELDSGLTTRLIRPNGLAVAASDPDVDITIMPAVDVGFTSSADRPIFTVTQPQIGTWRIEVSGPGTVDGTNFSVVARGGSPLHLDLFEFVTRPNDDAAYRPIDGQPLAGAPATGRARISSGILNPVFHLVDAAGTTLQTVTLTAEDPQAEPMYLVGSVPLPSAAFGVLVRGVDAVGGAVQRQLPATFRSQTVSVAFDQTDLIPVLAGTSRYLRIAVTNFGTQTATLNLSASSGLGSVRGMAPSSLTLAAGASAIANFYLDVPSDAEPGDGIKLLVSARNAADAAMYNTASFDLEVAYPEDLDGDQIPNIRDNCILVPNANQLDTDGEGIGNVCDADPTNPVTIIDFAPKWGPVGTLVTVSGLTFSPDPAQNAVTIAGVAATVESASAIQLVVRIPAGASTAPITVAAPGGSTMTAEPFIVESSAAPEITGFSPASGPSGTAVTISGAHFQIITAANSVRLNGTAAAVTSSSSAQLSTSVPAGATSGRFRVETPYGVAESAGDFIVPPSGFTGADIEFTGRIAAGEPEPLNVPLNMAGKIGVVLFDGTAGEEISLHVTDSTIAESRIRILAPDGTQLVNVMLNASVVIDAQALTASGTYTILLDPTGTYTGTARLTLHDATSPASAIVAGGDPVVVTTSVPGQYGRATFEGALGQRVSLALSNVAFGPSTCCAVRISIRNPDGSYLATPAFAGTSSGQFVDTLTLGAAGTYTIVLDPDGVNLGSATLRLYDVPADVASTISPGGSPVTVTTTTPGQNGALMFTGTAGQRVSLDITGHTAGTSTILILRPDGTTLASRLIVGGTGWVEPVSLPVDGAYLLVVNPSGANVGSLTVRMHVVTDLEGSIVPGGSPVAATVTMPGQNAAFSFTGSAGQRVSLDLSAVSIPSSIVSIVAPGGGSVVSTFVSGARFIDVMSLTVSGVYWIRVDPSAAGMGSMTLRLYDVPPDLTGTIAIGGDSLTVAPDVPGRNARIDFAGTTGQQVVLQLSGVTVASSTVSILRPDNTALATRMVNTSGATIDNLTLPANGTYTIVVDPTASNTGSVTLTLLATDDVLATIVPGGPPVTVSIQTVGQRARVTFTATALQRVSLKLTNVAMGSSTCCSTRVSILNPDGSTLSAPILVGTNGGFIDTRTITAAGTHAIIVDPEGSNVGSITLTLYDVPADASGTIAPGTPATVNLLTPGQNAALTFSGTAGQRVTLRMTSVTIGQSTVAIVNPDGTTLASAAVTTSGGFVDVRTLAASGTYSVRVDPSSANTGQMTLTLYDVPPEAAGSIVAGGAPVAVALPTPGQNAEYTFDGTAGQRVSLRMTSVSIANSTVSILNPDGSSLASAFVGTIGAFIDVRTLAASGSYKVRVDPSGTSTGNMTLTLYDVPADASGGATVGGSGVAVTTTVPGQNATVTFQGTTGQPVTVRLTGNSLGVVTVKLLRPDGTTAATSMSSLANFNMAAQTLQTSGTYTITIDPSNFSTGSITVSVTSP